jgi:dienelactone hydrolase
MSGALLRRMRDAASRRAVRWRVLVFVVATLLITLYRTAGAHVRAAGLLVRFADEHASGLVVDLGRHPVETTEASLDSASGRTRARLYVPRGVDDPPGIIIAHGIHRLGIDEPRLERFSRAIAATGVVVLTPELRDLADYHVDVRAIDTLGIAAHALRDHLGGERVGLMGLSFAGGLSLLAAADPRYADDLGFVVAIGAHDDLGRVSRFFATSEIERPDGTEEKLGAHAYGPLVLVYSHPEYFFSSDDVPIAEDALRLWLWEEKDAARDRAADLSPHARAKMTLLFESRIDSIAPELMEAIRANRDAMAPVSPHGRLASLRVPVYLLHGAGDTVIPAVETLWLASEVPADLLRETLVSPALVHVELDKKPELSEEWALLHFMAAVLEQAQRR